MRQSFAVYLALIALTFAGAAPASAAVRRCTPALTGGPQDAAAEVEAKQKALASWSVKASVYGTAFTSWRLAINRTLSCSKGPAGFTCEARGAPCALQQVPGPPPGETTVPIPPPSNAPTLPLRPKGGIST